MISYDSFYSERILPSSCFSVRTCNFEFSFKSSTENYKSGKFNESLKRVAEKYDDIMNMMIDDASEGINSFLEKRNPKWKDK